MGLKPGEETPEEKDPAPAPKEAKVDGLREIQKRIMSLEAELKGFKGAEGESIRAIAREEIKTLSEELAALKVSMTPPAAGSAERGLWDEIEDWLNGK